MQILNDLTVQMALRISRIHSHQLQLSLAIKFTAEYLSGIAVRWNVNAIKSIFVVS